MQTITIFEGHKICRTWNGKKEITKVTSPEHMEARMMMRYIVI